MGRKNAEVKNYQVGKGAYKGYWGFEALRDMLKHISKGNKSWGKDWYNAVESEFYQTALKLLDIHATGEDRDKAMDMVHRIIDIKNAERSGR